MKVSLHFSNVLVKCFLHPVAIHALAQYFSTDGQLTVDTREAATQSC